MRKKLFQTIITFFILTLSPFHIAYSQSQGVEGWVLIGDDLDLLSKPRVARSKDGSLYLNEKRIEQNDNTLILDVLISGKPGMRYKDTTTGETKEKPAFNEFNKYQYSSEIWKMELKCDTEGPMGSRLVKYSNPRRYSERMGKGVEYTDIDTSSKGLYEAMHGEHNLPYETHSLMKKKFPAFCVNFEEVKRRKK